MKRFLAALLAALLVFSLAACGGKTTEPENQETPSAEGAEAAEPGNQETSGAEGVEATEVRGVTIPAFSVTVNGVTVTNEEMAAYPVYSCECTSVNSKGTEATVVYQGFALKDLCDAAGLKEEYIWASAEASDGYKVEWTKDVMANSTMLAITRDGAQFEGAPWFAPCSTDTSGNILSGCAKIFVNTTAEMPVVEDEGSGETAPDAAPDTAEAGKPEIKDATANVAFNPYTFKVNGAEVNNDKLEGLSIYKIKVTTTNSKGEASENTYCGYKLADVLEACGVTEATSVKAIADDGYESELAAGQIASDWTLVAIEKDKEVGENGTIWIAPCESEFGNTYARNVIEIIAG